MPALPARAYNFVKKVWRDYCDDNGNLVAAAVSHYVFLSLVPLLLLGIAIVGYILGSPERAEKIVLSSIQQGAPEFAGQAGLDAVRDVVTGVVKGRGLATGLGLLVLLWTGSNVIVIIEQAINVAWRLDQRKFWRKRLIALFGLLAVYILFCLSFALTAAMGAIRTMDIRVFGIEPSQWPWIWRLVGYLAPAALSVLTFTLLYKFLPNTSVPWNVALVGGSFAGIMWEILKHVFNFYVTHFAHYSAIYGSLAGLVLLLIWIYFSAMLTILGAEMASLYAGRRSL